MNAETFDIFFQQADFNFKHLSKKNNKKFNITLSRSTSADIIKAYVRKTGLSFWIILGILALCSVVIICITKECACCKGHVG